MAPPQRVDIDPVSEIGSDHAEAGEPAFGGFGLQHDRHPGATPEIQILLLHAHIPLWSSGSMIHRASDRRSRIISALRSMPTCSGIFRPFASTSGRSSTAVALYAGSS